MRIKLLIIFVVGCVACSSLPAELPYLPTSTPPPAPTVPPTVTPTPAPERYSMAGFEEFVSTVIETDRDDRQSMVNKYMVGIDTTPLVTDDGVIFFWQGAAFDVRLVGDMTQFVPENDIPLSHIEDTDLWYIKLDIEPDARLDYLFRVDGETVVDRFNPSRIISGFGLRSELRMPAYAPPPELQPGRQMTTEHGLLANDFIDSAILGARRSIFVYTPARPPQDGEKYPSVYIHDGSDYINLINSPLILDWLIEQGEIPPVVAVFIPPVDRRIEYDRNLDYVRFLTDEVVPYVEDKYGTSSDPAQTATLGASMGGLISVYAAMNAPNVFGLVGSQSGALSFGRNGVITQVELQEPAVPVKFHLTIGTYDTAIMGYDAQDGNLYEGNKAFVEALRGRGYEFSYSAYPEGHSWGLWQAQLGNALRYLFSA